MVFVFINLYLFFKEKSTLEAGAHLLLSWAGPSFLDSFLGFFWGVQV